MYRPRQPPQALRRCTCGARGSGEAARTQGGAQLVLLRSLELLAQSLHLRLRGTRRRLHFHRSRSRWRRRQRWRCVVIPTVISTVIYTLVSTPVPARLPQP